MLVQLHIMGGNEDADGEWHDLQKWVMIDSKPEAHCKELIIMMTEVESMENGRLGSKSVAEHLIEFTSNKKRPSHRSPLESKSGKSDFEKVEIEKLS